MHFKVAIHFFQVSQKCVWTLDAKGSTVSLEQCPFLAGVSKEFTCVDDVLQLLRLLDASKICSGNRSQRFTSLAQSHKGVFKNKTSKYLHKLLLTMCLKSCKFIYRGESDCLL